MANRPDDGAFPYDVRFTRNLVTNWSFETNTTGWNPGGSNTITRVAALDEGIPKQHGDYVGKVTYQNTSPLVEYGANDITIDDALHKLSMQVYIPANWDGGTIQLTTQDYTGSPVQVVGSADMNVIDQWQFVEASIDPDSGDLTGTIIAVAVSGATATPGRSIYIDDIRAWKATEQYGFMLASPPGGSKTMTVSEIGGPAAQRITTRDEASHQDFEPTKDTPTVQQTFTGGLGYREESPAKDGYWWGVGVSHVEGKYFAPPASTELTAAGSATGLPRGFLSWATAAGVRYDFWWEGVHVYRRPDDTTSNWTLVHTASWNVTDIVPYDNALVVFYGDDQLDDADSLDYHFVNDPTAATWATSTVNSATHADANGFPQFGRTVRGTLYACGDPEGLGNENIWFSTDPFTPTWTGPIDVGVGTNNGGKVGTLSYPFVNMIAAGDFLFAFKQDAGYNIDSSQEVAEVIWQFKSRPSPSNFKYVASANGQIIFSAQNEVYTYDPVTGALDSLDISKRDGFAVREIKGVAADDRFVYVSLTVQLGEIETVPQRAILAAWRRPGMDRYSLECIWQDDANGDADDTDGLHAASRDPGSGPEATRLYFGRQNSTSYYVDFIDIPREWDPTMNNTLSYQTAATLYTSIYRTGFPQLQKRHLWLTTEFTTATSPGSTSSISYSTDKGENFTTLAGSLGEGVHTHSYGGIGSKSLVLLFNLASALASSTHAIEGFDHHQRVRFRYLEAPELTIRIADNIEGRNGVPTGETKHDLREALRLIREEEDKTLIFESFQDDRFACSVDRYIIQPVRHDTAIEDEYEQEALIVVSRMDKGD